MPRNRSHMLTTVKGRPMNIKTPLCREFEKDLTTRLEVFKAEIKDFVSCYKPTKHFIEAEYIIHTPKEVLFTKEGKISQHATDLDAHKAMQDTIFKALGLDDSLVRDARYKTPISSDGFWNYDITFWLKPISYLEGDDGLL